MHKNGIRASTLAAVLVLALPVAVSAQSVYFGAGASFPTGDYGDYAKTGVLAVGGLEYPIGPQGLDVFAEGFFGQNTHKDDGAKTQPFGAMGGLLYSFVPEGASPYVFAQAGVLVHRYSPDQGDSESDSGFGYGGGIGYALPLGSIDGFVEGRFLSASISGDQTSFFAVDAGISIPLGMRQ